MGYLIIAMMLFMVCAFESLLLAEPMVVDFRPKPIIRASGNALWDMERQLNLIFVIARKRNSIITVIIIIDTNVVLTYKTQTFRVPKLPKFRFTREKDRQIRATRVNFILNLIFFLYL